MALLSYLGAYGGTTKIGAKIRGQNYSDVVFSCLFEWCAWRHESIVVFPMPNDGDSGARADCRLPRLSGQGGWLLRWRPKIGGKTVRIGWDDVALNQGGACFVRYIDLY